MSLFNEDRNHAPTPTRLRRARQDGDVAYNRELATAIQILAGVATLWFSLSTLGKGLGRVATQTWRSASISTSSAMTENMQSMVWLTLRLLLPTLISLSVIGMLAHLIQTQFLIRAPKISLSTVSGKRWFSRMFSFASVGQILFATPQAMIGLLTGGFTIWILRESFFALGGQPTDVMADSLFRLTAIVGFAVGISLFCCSLIDYGFRWFARWQRLHLTDQEMREERRGQTLDPQIARIQHDRMRDSGSRR